MELLREILTRYPRIGGVVLGLAFHPVLHQLLAIR